MLIVFRKVETTNPGKPWIWTVAADFQDEADLDGENGDARLRGLGPGEMEGAQG